MSDSGFELGLDDPGRSGVFFVTAEDLDTLAAAARDAALLVRRIDLSSCGGKSTLLLRIALALDFPATSGHNWDALADNLRDLDWLPANGYALLFESAGDLREADQASFDMLLSVLDEARSDWTSQGVPFWSFLALRETDFEALESASGEE